GSRSAFCAARAGPGPRGSGSSRSRCRGTPFAAPGKPRRSSAAGAALAGRRRAGRMQAQSSFLQEGELVLADLELVAVLEPGRRVDPLAVQEGAVEAPLVLDVE